MVEPLVESHLRSSGRIPGAVVHDLELPPGYEAQFLPRGERGTPAGSRHPRGGRIVILRSDARDKLLRAAIWDPERVATGPLVVDWIEGGRTRHALLETGGESWVLKSYRRGGAVGALNSARYWGARRFVRELEVASTARAMGVATAEVLALILESAGFGSLRAWLVSRYLPGVRPLYEFFGSHDEVALSRAAGELVARMHAAGIDHPDLHLGNIVATLEDGHPSAFIIDWDRARRREVGVWNPCGNLIRLWRSVEKGRRRVAHESRGAKTGMSGAPSACSMRAFIRGYFKGRPRALRAARGYFRRRALLLELRTLFWRSPR